MDVTCIPFQFPGLKNVHCAFQTRIGGSSSGTYGGGNISLATSDVRENVIRNRQDLQTQLGLEYIAELNQIHTDILVFDPSPVPADGSPAADADGMATAAPGLGLCIKTADCQAILFAHKDGRHIMAVHAGWRGNRCNFPVSAVQRFCDKYSLDPADIFAVRGPSLGRAEFVNFDTDWGPDFKPWFNERDKLMDLWGLTRYQLSQAGLLPRNIFSIDMCTATMDYLFFSYRKEKNTGRQASVIWFR